MSSPRAYKRGAKPPDTGVPARQRELNNADRARVLRAHLADPGKDCRQLAAVTGVDWGSVEAIVTAWGHRASEQIAWLEGA